MLALKIIRTTHCLLWYRKNEDSKRIGSFEILGSTEESVRDKMAKKKKLGTEGKRGPCRKRYDLTICMKTSGLET